MSAESVGQGAAEQPRSSTWIVSRWSGGPAISVTSRRPSFATAGAVESVPPNATVPTKVAEKKPFS